MKKGEAEAAIRQLSRDWFSGLTEAEKAHPSFTTFKAWAVQRGYGHYFNFKSLLGPDENAELWFDDALQQGWRR